MPLFRWWLSGWRVMSSAKIWQKLQDMISNSGQLSRPQVRGRQQSWGNMILDNSDLDNVWHLTVYCQKIRWIIHPVFIMLERVIQIRLQNNWTVHRSCYCKSVVTILSTQCSGGQEVGEEGEGSRDSKYPPLPIVTCYLGHPPSPPLTNRQQHKPFSQRYPPTRGSRLNRW